ncbi:MAG: aminomethyl-transferring glycine dehydrogenase subunit GcvPA [Candidatus Marinimicrobia bacterium]|nr:aminomethyl-transferring glycine dehydrogenase subunit GcvPA [Candidatus Neomarinimicrobiota bacterium]
MPFLPHAREDAEKMLRKIGVGSFEELLRHIPEVLRSDTRINLPRPLSELEIQKALETLDGENKACRNTVSFLGGGAYDHFIPKVVDFIISRSEFATAYTPYQAEVSQGTLQAMYEFQSLICELTGMDVSNASMYDGASAMAEAVIMAKNLKRRSEVIVSSAVNPLYRRTLETYARSQDIRIIECPLKGLVTDPEALAKHIGGNTAAVIVQSPNFFGCIEDTEAAATAAHQQDALFIQGADPVSLSLLKTPGEADADIAFGEGQSLGNPLNFGGSYLGLFATKKAYIRKMPGRIAGMTEDTEGRRAFVLTLQTREQHIRREKATSNICSNEALCALAATVYLALMGTTGLRKTAELCIQKSHYLHGRVSGLPGFSAASEDPFFKEFVIRTPLPAKHIVKKAKDCGFDAGVDLGRFYPGREHELLIAVTEKRSKADMDAFVECLSGIPQ